MRDHLRTARPVARLKQGRSDWYSLKNLSTDAGPVAQLYIYDEIGYFGVTAADLIAALQGVTEPTIDVRLNSPGGDVFDGIAILNTLRSHPATVNVTIDSLAASIASVIAMAGDSITIMPGAQMMIHEASSITIGNSADMRGLADLLDRQSDNIAGLYAARAGGTAADWRSAMVAETWYTADEAVEAGLADQVGQFASRSGSSAENSWDLSVFNYAGRENAPAPQAPAQIEPEFDADLFRRAFEEAGK